MKPQKAQGTVEYLVIIAVVVIVALLAATVMITTSTNQNISQNTNNLSSRVGSGAISVSEAVIDTNGDSLITLQNTSSDPIVITKVSTSSQEALFNSIVGQGDTTVISLANLNLDCPCESGATTTTCEYTISYTQKGLSKIASISKIVQCTSDTTTSQTSIEPETVYLSQNCFNANENPIKICTLTDLNRVRDYLDRNFELQADINASETTTWDNGAGWIAIGTCGAGWECWMNNYTYTYRGYFNGNNKTILNLYLNRPTTDYGGLFGYSTGTITNLGIIDNNIIGQGYTGGIAGINSGTLTNVYNTGTISGITNVGGVSGNNTGTITDSYAVGNVNGTSAVWGLIGSNSGTITNSFYDYETVLINGENSPGIFGIDSTTFNYWLSHNKQLLGLENYLTLDGDYYLIETVDDFKKLLAYGQEDGRKFKLVNNLDFSGENNFYIPTLTSDFNGNNKTISNLTINLPTTDYVGLFGYSTGDISNLGLIDNNIIGNSYIGGITGYLSGTISNSYSAGDVKGTSSVGGITGTLTGTITNTYNTGNTSGSNDIGGIAGRKTGTITNSYNTGNTNGFMNTGGISGWSIGTISNSYNTGNTIGTADYTGGIAGYSGGTILNSYNVGNTLGTISVGGLCGSSNGTVTKTYNIGNITGTLNYIGGIIGYNNGRVTFSYSVGDINGVRYVGGIIGRSLTTSTQDINMNYSISKVTRTSGSATEVRGLVGYAANTASVGNAFWSPTLSTYSTCYRTTVDTNTNCTAITSTATNFYGAAGIPFANLLFDGNWTARANDYPILTWQVQ